MFWGGVCTRSLIETVHAAVSADADHHSAATVQLPPRSDSAGWLAGCCRLVPAGRVVQDDLIEAHRQQIDDIMELVKEEMVTDQHVFRPPSHGTAATTAQHRLPPTALHCSLRLLIVLAACSLVFADRFLISTCGCGTICAASRRTCCGWWTRREQ